MKAAICIKHRTAVSAKGCERCADQRRKDRLATKRKLQELRAYMDDWYRHNGGAA